MEHHTRTFIRIFMFLLIFAGPCFSQNISVWSCDFEKETCGIIEERGTWLINYPPYYGELLANFSNEMAQFSLPIETTSANGNLSFVYKILGSCQLSVSLCASENRTIFEGNTGSVLMNDTEIPYSCEDMENAKIRFVAKQTNPSITPTITLDDIEVYQMQYAAPSVTTQPSTDSIITNLTFETHTSANRKNESSTFTDDSEAPSVTTQPSTDSITTNPTFETHTSANRKNESSTSTDDSEAQTPATPRLQDRPTWIIPVAAGIGSFVAAIAVLITVLCYCRQRNRATKTKGKLANVNGTTPHADPEVRYSYPNQPSDLVYYADIKDDLGPDGHRVPKSTAAADFKVNNPNSAISSNLVKNPVYERSDQIPKVSDPLNADINDPVYEEAPDNPTQQSLQLNDLVENPLYGGQEQRSAAAQGSFKQPESAELQDLVDNPLYGGQDEGSRVQDSPHQAGSADSDGLVDNPLYGGQSDRSASHASNMPNVLPGIPSPDDLRSNKSDAESRRLPPEQGLSTQPEYAAVDDLIDNPLYGSQNDKTANDGVTLQNESCANDELIDNPLYGAQSTQPDGLASNLQLSVAPTEELVDNPLYGDGGERPGRQGVTSQTGMEPTDELIDNPLYGSQNESSAIGISRQESGPSDEMTDNPLYGANS